MKRAINSNVKIHSNRENVDLVRHVKGKKIKLKGFNNLTKTLSFNIYDICYAKSQESIKDYLEYIDEIYNSEKLLKITETVTDIINAKLVNVSTQDYEPRGASITALINETDFSLRSQTMASVTGHLDKSHITAHTYPEENEQEGIASFRVDIDISTCGMISPLNALNYLIDSFESDIVIMDYRVRGFTREQTGNKIFMDHDIHSIQDYIPDDILNLFHAYDINIVSSNIFHTKMMRKDIDISNYLFSADELKIIEEENEKTKVQAMLAKEIREIFEGHNIE